MLPFFPFFFCRQKIIIFFFYKKNVVAIFVETLPWTAGAGAFLGACTLKFDFECKLGEKFYYQDQRLTLKALAVRTIGGALIGTFYPVTLPVLGMMDWNEK